MEEEPTRINGVDVHETPEELTVALSSDGVLVLLVRMRDYGRAEEAANGAGVVVSGPVSSWTLIDGVLTFEYNDRAAAALGFPRLHALCLEIPENDLRQLCDALLEILSGTCCVVETPEGRIVQ